MAARNQTQFLQTTTRSSHEFWCINSSAAEDSILLRYNVVPLNNWFTFMGMVFQSSGPLEIEAICSFALSGIVAR
jgi:hypothetical protein